MKELMKLYEKMTPHEQGIVGFTFLANQNEDGFKRIMSKVPRVSYIETHDDWQSVLNKLGSFVKIYAWSYWELRAHRAECFAISYSYMTKANKALGVKDEQSIKAFWEAQDKSDNYRQEYDIYTQEMRALHKAAKQVCETNGYPLEDIRKCAGISLHMIDDGETTPEFKAKYVSLFETVAVS